MVWSPVRSREVKCWVMVLSVLGSSGRIVCGGVEVAIDVACAMM